MYWTARSKISAFSSFGFCKRCEGMGWGERGLFRGLSSKWCRNNYEAVHQKWILRTGRLLTVSAVFLKSRSLNASRLWFIRSLLFFSITGFSLWKQKFKKTLVWLTLVFSIPNATIKRRLRIIQCVRSIIVAYELNEILRIWRIMFGKIKIY